MKKTYNRTKIEKGQTLIEFALVIVIIVIIFIMSGCSLNEARKKINSYLEERQKDNPAEIIIFSGKVVDVVNGQWPNDRLVVLFLNGKEISRTKSELNEFIYSGEGKHDGLFVVTIENTYELTENDFNYDGNKGVNFETNFEKNWGIPKSKSLYRWFGEVEQDTFIDIPVVSKNLRFILFIFEEPFDTLSAEIQKGGSLTIKQDGTIYVNGNQIP